MRFFRQARRHGFTSGETPDAAFARISTSEFELNEPPSGFDRSLDFDSFDSWRPPAPGKNKIWTDAELEALPKDGYKRELLDGKIIMSPVHINHGIVCMNLGSLLASFVQQHKLGVVCDSSTGFRLSENLLLSPDISFVSSARSKKSPSLQKVRSRRARSRC